MPHLCCILGQHRGRVHATAATAAAAAHPRPAQHALHHAGLHQLGAEQHQARRHAAGVGGEGLRGGAEQGAAVVVHCCKAQAEWRCWQAGGAALLLPS